MNVGRKQLRPVKGYENLGMSQPAYNPPKIGRVFIFPPVEPQERKEETYETKQIKAQNLRAKRPPIQTKNSMSYNKAYGDSHKIKKEGNEMGSSFESALEKMQSQVPIDTNENKRFFSSQIPHNTDLINKLRDKEYETEQAQSLHSEELANQRVKGVQDDKEWNIVNAEIMREIEERQEEEKRIQEEIKIRGIQESASEILQKHWRLAIEKRKEEQLRREQELADWYKAKKEAEGKGAEEKKEEIEQKDDDDKSEVILTEEELKEEEKDKQNYNTLMGFMKHLEEIYQLLKGIPNKENSSNFTDAKYEKLLIKWNELLIKYPRKERGAKISTIGGLRTRVLRYQEEARKYQIKLREKMKMKEHSSPQKDTIPDYYKSSGSSGASSSSSSTSPWAAGGGSSP
jgi:hypothetical protein